MGTAAYMSPEQARGEVSTLGPATDVYGLGATLYEVLTNRPPLQGTFKEVLGKASRGEWLPARQVNKAVPPALDAICGKAMALRPEQRYASAQALAGDVEHWLADEPVTAYREPVWTGPDTRGGRRRQEGSPEARVSAARPAGRR
jgi:serine/threonine protein kinase